MTRSDHEKETLELTIKLEGDVSGGSVPRREAQQMPRISRTGLVTSQAPVGLAEGQRVLSSPWGLTHLFPLGKWADKV